MLRLVPVAELIQRRCCSLIYSSRLLPARSISATRKLQLKEIFEKADGNITTIEGVYVKSPREDHVYKDSACPEACPLCRLNMKIQYTDVLILSQFVRPDGTLLPRKVTGLCRYQNKRVATLLEQAEKAGLMPTLRPLEPDGKEPDYIMPPYKYKKYNVYFKDKKY